MHSSRSSSSAVSFLRNATRKVFSCRSSCATRSRSYEIASLARRSCRSSSSRSLFFYSSQRFTLAFGAFLAFTSAFSRVSALRIASSLVRTSAPELYSFSFCMVCKDLVSVSFSVVRSLSYFFRLSSARAARACKCLFSFSKTSMRLTRETCSLSDVNFPSFSAFSCSSRNFSRSPWWVCFRRSIVRVS